MTEPDVWPPLGSWEAGGWESEGGGAEWTGVSPASARTMHCTDTPSASTVIYTLWNAPLLFTLVT